MKILVPTHATHSNLILAKHGPSWDFFDHLDSADWVDLKKSGSHQTQSLSYYTVPYAYEAYNRVRKSMRRQLDRYLSLQRCIKRLDGQVGGTSNPSYGMYVKTLADFKDFCFWDKQVQRDFWYRFDKELVVREYSIDPYTMTVNPEKTHKLSEYGPKKISPMSR